MSFVIFVLGKFDFHKKSSSFRSSLRKKSIQSFSLNSIYKLFVKKKNAISAIHFKFYLTEKKEIYL